MITVLGTGTGAPLGRHARVALASAGLVVGARRHLDAAELPPRAERVVLGPLAPALDRIGNHLAGIGNRPPEGEGSGGGSGEGVVVLASGDPGFFGMVRALAERFGAAALEVAPAVPSVAVAFARVGLPWDDAVVVSAHGRDLRTAVNVCRAHPKAAVLTGPGAGPAELGAALARAGTERTLVVASALGEPGGERVERLSPAEAAARDWRGAVSIVLCLDGTRALSPALRTVAGPRPGPGQWALPEGEFEHRDSLITKYEVRALALARLGPGVGDLVWDVGAGSGSVAVECARLGAAAVAVEKTADGVARIRANAAAHGVDVQAVHGSAPAALDRLPDPDGVFVGGGGAGLPAIVAECARRARRGVVVTLAALDRVPAVRAALAGAGLLPDGVLLQSSRLAPLPGEVTRLAAANPVFVLWGTRAPGARARTPTGPNPPGSATVAAGSPRAVTDPEAADPEAPGFETADPETAAPVQDTPAEGAPQ
ncbi:precorrin-6y C5,15-methyltransferase (decarboxylating) subunit CbiE [Streptomyces pathocidini]|uniref:Precorrin-6y C5,15-methyltransferase (Decarboxylating) subunit CbiE n=1 Tax=Streptomyces pathocidini TaxID=1650571 RepID=A0ABW7UZI3_9ACTN|nr:precorrin-6y C5,15-methyltransferase (decarboxylating) subunit CbiE [Streptomyces pathocidini]